MLKLAHHGTVALLFLSALAACSEARQPRQPDDAGEAQAAGGGASEAGSGGSTLAAMSAADSGSATTSCEPLRCPSGSAWSADECACAVASADPDACRIDSDCALAGRGCCHCAPATQESTIAVHRDRLREVLDLQCPPGQPPCHCPAEQLDPLAPILHAACVQSKCAALDLRTLELSKCSRDSDCVAEGLGCCGATSGIPRDYVGVNRGADDSILQCFPAPPCDPPSNPASPPASFCASDGHCAVRTPEKLLGVPSTSCYSPAQNVDHAYDDGAIGCDCRGASACRKDSTGRYVGFICSDQGTWQAVNDGPCGKKP